MDSKEQREDANTIKIVDDETIEDYWNYSSISPRLNFARVTDRKLLFPLLSRQPEKQVTWSAIRTNNVLIIVHVVVSFTGDVFTILRIELKKLLLLNKVNLIIFRSRQS